MTHGSLFSGIGGFDLAAEWMGWENVFHCENNPFSRRHLKYYWPNAISYHDITKTDFNVHRGTIDILTGGFPCQPYSQAGKRLGKEDERHLWPHMLRAIREIQPRWVVGENVLGLVNWSGGLVFEEVWADLEAEGYEVQPYVLPAAAVNAPHRRDRVWFVAYAKGSGNRRKLSGLESENDFKRESKEHGENNSKFRNNVQKRDAPNANGIGRDNGSDNWGERQVPHYEERNTTENESERSGRVGGTGEICGDGDAADTKSGWSGGIREQSQETRSPESSQLFGSGSRISDEYGDGNLANTNGKMLEHGDGKRKAGKRTNEEERIESFGGPGGWETFPTVPPICDGDDGISDRLDGITFSRWRQESIKGGGNAVVPQVVHAIFKTIEEYEKLNK